ncbi:MAG: polysaccharide biosynthesis protein [Anaerolineae bacterium]|nr:polysaccharide biosynthesis protein [Anaerolineae bacterium]
MSILARLKTNGKKVFSLFPKITGDILIYGVGGSFSQFIGFIYTMVVTRVLSSSEFGSVDVINATTGYFSALISLNLISGLMRHYFEVPDDDPVERRKLVSSLIWFIVLFGGLVVLVGALFSQRISLSLFKSDVYASTITLALASLPFISLKNVFSSVLQMKRKPAQYLTINILYAILNVLLVVLFVEPLGFRIDGIFLAQLVTAVVMMLFGAWQCREVIGLTFSRMWFTRLAAYSLPKVPGTLFQWGMSSINRLLLTQYTTATQIGYYSIATKPVRMMELANTSFGLAWTPVFMKNINSETFQTKLNRGLRYYMFAVLLLGAAITAFAREIIHILAPPEYQAAVVLVGLFGFKQAISGVYHFTSFGVIQTKKTIYDSVSFGVGVAVTVGVSLLLMPRYGIYGAAIADLCGQVVKTILHSYIAYRLKPIRWTLTPLLLALGGFIALWLGTVWVQLPNAWLDLLLRVGMLVLYAVFVLVIVDRGEIIGEFWRSLREKFAAPASGG